VFNFQLSVRP